ncbi:unnamed protein product [Lactuca saligna]|uniref:Uncharacterized protein n=1 Tax=Lactuca saligna TaxID=75948 RepID=A0AA35YI84_LACSI|nr:unnamed protein product [Lactuca saligna]
MEVVVPIVDDGKARSDILLFNRRTYNDIQVPDLYVLLLHQSTQSTCLIQLEDYGFGVVNSKVKIIHVTGMNQSQLSFKNCRKENSTCLVALGTNDGKVFTISATSTELKWKSSGHYHRIAALSFANKGCKLCAISTDGTICEMNCWRQWVALPNLMLSLLQKECCPFDCPRPLCYSFYLSCFCCPSISCRYTGWSNMIVHAGSSSPPRFLCGANIGDEEKERIGSIKIVSRWTVARGLTPTPSMRAWN